MTDRIFALVLATLLFSSCGLGDREEAETPAVAFAHERAGGGSGWGSSSPVRRVNVDAAGFEADLHGRYRVAPDRALVRVEVDAAAPSRSAAARRAREAAAEVAETLSDGRRCIAEVVDFGTPRRINGAWTASAALRFDVPLGGIAEVSRRFARVEHCMTRFSEIGPALRDVELAVSDPLPTLDAPSQHRGALLQRAFEGAREVAVAEDLQSVGPEAMRCASSGRVSVTERSLQGIALSVDLQCAPRGFEEAAPAAERAGRMEHEYH